MTTIRATIWVTLPIVAACLLKVVVSVQAAASEAGSVPVYMHYMPWFDTPEVLGGSNWGLHWTGAGSQNPNIVDPQGKLQIASNYYPKIGPYQSSNSDVIEYHMLLLKMAGVDGSFGADVG